MVMYKLHKKEIPFTCQTDQELEKIYSGKHIIPYKASEIESFTAKIIIELVMKLIKIS